MAIKLQGLETDLNIDTSKWHSGIKGAIAVTATLIASVAALGVGVGKMVQKTFEWAGELDSVQDIMGGTNEEAAAFNFILHKSGVETSKFTQGLTILEKGLVKADGSLDDIGKKLAEFGINALDANGAVKDQASLMREISDTYNSFATQQERVNFLTELFGKSGAGLIDVFDTLAGEGGLDRTIEKTKALGLAIDPAKYEQFQRNLNELKLAGLGLAVTFVDFLMPAFEAGSRWWQNTGLPAFMSMRKWLGENIPIVVDTTKKVFDKLGITWNTTIKPAADELVKLWNLLTQAGQRLSPNTDEVAGKFTVLGATIRVVVGLGAAIAGALEIMTTGLRIMNTVLQTAINLWDRFRSSSSAGASVSIPTPATSGGASGRPARSGRQHGGPMIAGHSYNILEAGRAEVFTPNTGGKMDKSLEVTLSKSDLDRIGDAAGRSSARAIAPLVQRRMPA